MAVLPVPNGSQAMPTRGAIFLLSSLDTLSPNGEVVPAMANPFSRSRLAACGHVAGLVSSVPLALMQGAWAGLNKLATKFESLLLASVGWRNMEYRAP